MQASGRLARTAGYYLAFIALGLAGASLGPTLAGLAAHTGSRLSAISFIFTASSLGYLIGSFGGGRLYDRVPGHSLMVGVLVAMAAGLALVPLIPVLWLLIAARLLVSVAEGAVDVGGNTLLVWAHGEGVGPYMNGLHLAFGVGAFVSPLIIAQAMRLSGDITWAYWALALCALPAALWLARLPSPPRRRIAHEAAPAAPAESPALSGKGAVRQDPWGNPLVALLTAFFFLYVAAEVCFGDWAYTYALSLGLGDAAGAAYLTAAFWGAFMGGRLLGVGLAARFCPERILLGDLAGCLLSLGVIFLLPRSAVALWVGTLGLGLSMASIFPTTYTLAGQRLSISGRIAGWFAAGASAGGMLLPWVVGQLFEPVGPRVTVWALGVDLLVAAGVYAALVRREA